MTTRVLGLVCVACAWLAHAEMRFHGPDAHGDHTFPVLWRSKFLGTHPTNLSLAEVAVAVLEGDTPLVRGEEAANCGTFRGTIVLVDPNTSMRWKRSEEFSTALVLEDCGARAVVFLIDHPNDVAASVGYDVYAWDFDCCKSQRHAIGIPVLATWHDNAVAVFEDVARGANVTATVGNADDNPWVAAYNDIAFVVFGRALLAAANVAVALLALRAWYRHTSALLRARNKPATTVFKSNRAFILIALVLQICASLVRAVYCAMGPFLSTDDVRWSVNMVFLTLCIPLQLPIICVVCFLFLRMISVRPNVAPPRKAHVAAVGVVCVVALVADLIGSYGRDQGTDLPFFMYFSVVSGVMITLGSLVLFLVGGLPFLWRLHTSTKIRAQGHGTQVARAVRARFARTVVYGSTGLIMQLVFALCVALFPDTAYSPTGWCHGWAFMFWGFTITAAFHTLAVAPLVRPRVRFPRKKASVPVTPWVQWVDQDMVASVRPPQPGGGGLLPGRGDETPAESQQQQHHQPVQPEEGKQEGGKSQQQQQQQQQQQHQQQRQQAGPPGDQPCGPSPPHPPQHRVPQPQFHTPQAHQRHHPQPRYLTPQPQRHHRASHRHDLDDDEPDEWRDWALDETLIRVHDGNDDDGHPASDGEGRRRRRFASPWNARRWSGGQRQANRKSAPQLAGIEANAGERGARFGSPWRARRWSGKQKVSRWNPESQVAKAEEA